VKKILILVKILLIPFFLNASDTPTTKKWVYVATNESTYDKFYIMRSYEIKGEQRTFTFLIDWYDTKGGERSAISYNNVTHCNRPHRVMLGDTEGFTGKQGTGRSLGIESGAFWETIPDDSILRGMVNMVCKK